MSADEIRRLSRVIEMNYVDSENALDACHKRIKKLENRLKVEESRHLKELSQLQALMASHVRLEKALSEATGIEIGEPEPSFSRPFYLDA